MTNQSRSRADGNSLDAFLKHKPNMGGSKFLKGWTEKGKLYAWLHTLQLPIGLWRHQMPMLVIKEDKQTRKIERHVWSQSWNCHEDEDVLKQLNARWPTSAGKTPSDKSPEPTRCPFCRFIDWIYDEVRAGRLSWVDPVLRVEGADNPKENVIVHAGGFYNGFADYNGRLTDEQKDEMKKAGIYVSEAWKENGKAKLSYVFTIVDNDNIQDGVQVTTETQGLGDKVKGVINDRLESAGVEKGNPQTNPYCIEFTYDEKGKFDEKYHARYIEKIGMTPEIERLIRSDPPDLSNAVAPFNMQTFRAQLERCLVVKAPLDRIFKVEAPDNEGGGGEFPHGANANERPSVPEVSTREEPPPPPPSEPKTDEKKTTSGGRKPRVPPKAEAKTNEIPPEEMGDPCDQCASPMRKTDTKCAACGMEYVVDPDDASSTPAETPCKHCHHVFASTIEVCPKCKKKRLPF